MALPATVLPLLRDAWCLRPRRGGESLWPCAASGAAKLPQARPL